jgi:hypothetical protein
MTIVLPRENLIRGCWPGVRLRTCPDEARAADPFAASADPADGPGMIGHFAVFNRWTEIDSMWEGRFMERMAPGAFTKTFRENRDGMRVLFQHGRDPQIAYKPLGPIRDLAEDDFGAGYNVDLLDTSYNRDLIPGLQAGQYGASFRFSVLREDLVMEPKRSDYNPDGIPERTVREARVSEFGPVTFPAYQDATAGMRSLTDEDLIERLANDPERLTKLLERVGGRHLSVVGASTTDPVTAPPDDAGPGPTSEGRREAAAQLRPLVVTRNPNRPRRTA